MSAKQIIDIYISFFEKRGHKRIPNSPLIPENDPTTLFTSSGMQPLVPYLLGQAHPEGTRLVNVQNCFRAVDIDEVGDNRHTTFFRMLGNWSLGDYFKKEQLPWFWEFLTKELGIDPKKLFVTVFESKELNQTDEESIEIWNEIFNKEGLNPADRVRSYGVDKNWWSRSGTPDKMPVGEPGGPDSEVFYDFGTAHDKKFGDACHPNCDCGRFIEIGNSVFMQYIKKENGFSELPKKNVDFGAGVERLLMAVENQSDIFKTSLFSPIIKAIEELTNIKYEENQKEMRVIADHLTASVFLSSNGVIPSNKEQGYILRRVIRRSADNLNALGSEDLEPLIDAVVNQYSQTDEDLKNKFEEIKAVILKESNNYKKTLTEAKKLIEKELSKTGGGKEISAELAFKSMSSYGLSPTQLKSLGYEFNEKELANLIDKHAEISRAGATKKFAGGLADHSEQTVRGHTATHLMHQAIRDMLGTNVHQSGSNITSERVRFDFNFDRNLTEEEIKELEVTVNEKIKSKMPVYFEFMPLTTAKEIGAIGLFDEKYSDKVKIYLIGDKNPEKAYSKEFCGGPHVNFTDEVKSFKIIKQENIGNGLRRLYVTVG